MKRRRSIRDASPEERIAPHDPDGITDAINRALDEIGDSRDEFVAEASRRILERVERCSGVRRQRRRS